MNLFLTKIIDLKNNKVIQYQLTDYILKVLYRWAVIEAF
jgi:hypothetical protein